jgi:hypothetical protein
MVWSALTLSNLRIDELDELVEYVVIHLVAGKDL